MEVFISIILVFIIVGLICGLPNSESQADASEWEPNPGAVQFPTKREFDELSLRLPFGEYYSVTRPTCERCGSTNVTRSTRIEKEAFGKATKTIYTCKYCNYKKITSVPHSFWGPGRSR